MMVMVYRSHIHALCCCCSVLLFDCLWKCVFVHASVHICCLVFSTHHCRTGQDTIMSDIILLDSLTMVDRERVNVQRERIFLILCMFVKDCIPLFRRHKAHGISPPKDENGQNKGTRGRDGLDGKTDGPFPLWSQHPPHVSHRLFFTPRTRAKWKRKKIWVCVPLRAHFFFLYWITTQPHLHEGIRPKRQKCKKKKKNMQEHTRTEEVSRSVIHESMTKAGNTKHNNRA